MPRALLTIPAAVLGLCVGSFLTVVAHRVPRSESIVLPGSACPSCNAPIQARDNVPLISYVMLRGRCRHCRNRISIEYPLVEALTGALFVAAVLTFKLPVAAMIGPFLGLMVVVAVIDARYRIIPNRIIYPSLALFALALVAVAVAAGGVNLGSAGLGLLAYGGGLLVIALVLPGGMGMGDVKLAALIGLVLGALGWRYVGMAAMVGILAGGLGAVFALARGGSRKDTMPFGPYMAAAAVLAALFAPQVVSWYSALGR